MAWLYEKTNGKLTLRAPPDPVSVTVAVPPLHGTGEVTAEDPERAAGCVTGSVPVTGPQLFASVMLHE